MSMQRIVCLHKGCRREATHFLRAHYKNGRNSNLYACEAHVLDELDNMEGTVDGIQLPLIVGVARIRYTVVR